MHLSAPCSTRHAALFLLAHKSALRRHALPGTPITALPGASNGGFYDHGGTGPCLNKTNASNWAAPCG